MLLTYFEVLPLDEGAHLWFPGQYGRYQFPRYLLLPVVLVDREPLLQPQFALPTEQQHELHPGLWWGEWSSSTKIWNMV